MFHYKFKLQFILILGAMSFGNMSSFLEILTRLPVKHNPDIKFLDYPLQTMVN